MSLATFGMNRESFRHRQQDVGRFFQSFEFRFRVGLFLEVFGRSPSKAFPETLEHKRLHLRRRFANLVKRALKEINSLFEHLLGIVLRQHTFGRELFGVDIKKRRMFFDDVVHQRLRERGLIAFVVTETAVANHVDDDVAFKFLAETDGDVGRANTRFDVVGVHVNDGRLNDLRHVGRVR